MQWCHWQCHWCHVMPMALHDQKGHIASDFDHHDLRFAMVSLIMWWCYRHHVMWCQHQWHHMTKEITSTSFWLSWSRKWMVPLIELFGIRWHCCQWYHMTKKSYCTSFQLSLPEKCNGPIDDAISIMWCWHWYQWYHMTKNVLLHLISVVLT